MIGSDTVTGHHAATHVKLFPPAARMHAALLAPWVPVAVCFPCRYYAYTGFNAVSAL